MKWPVLLGVVLFAFAPRPLLRPGRGAALQVRQPWLDHGGRHVAPLLARLLALCKNFGSYDATFGSFAGIIILMLYIYYSSFIMLIGAQINQVIEDHHPEGKDEGEKTLNTGQEPA